MVMLDRGLLMGRRNVWYLVQSVILLVLLYQPNTLAAPAANRSHETAGLKSVVVKEGIHKLGFNETHHEHALVFPGEFPHHQGKYMHNSKLPRNNWKSWKSFGSVGGVHPLFFSSFLLSW